MTRMIAVQVSATVLAGLLWTGPALAQRAGGWGGHPGTVGRAPAPARLAVAPQPGLRPGQHHSAFQHHSGFRHHRGAFPRGGSVLYAPGYAYGYPAYGYPAYGGSVYAEPPIAYAPAPAYSYPPAYAYPPATSLDVAPAPPMPTVIEHATGRYELRGDGITTAYRWVWVPNPPATPPAPPPAVTPPPPPPASAPTEPSPRRGTLYRWTDREGVVHWTDNASTVPKEYRAKVEARSL